jgi:hypothetical protein
MRVALLLSGGVVADIDLAADQRLDAGLLRMLVELDGAREAPVIGQRDGGHLELGGAGSERGNAASPVEDRVLGVDVKVDELSQGPRSNHECRMPIRRADYVIPDLPKRRSKPDKTSLVIDREKVDRVKKILGATTLAAALADGINHDRRVALFDRIMREVGIGPGPNELARLRKP